MSNEQTTNRPDAIDARELSNEDLLEAFGKHFMLEYNGHVTADYGTYWDVLTARLAPRADALIEREQVETALFDVLNEVEDWALLDLVNAVMALFSPKESE